MQIREYEIMSGLEENHWWFWGKRRILMGMMTTRRAGPGPRTILDIGCGTGGLLKELDSQGQVFGLDIQKEALEFARGKTAAHLTQGSAMRLPFRDEAFDVAFCCDLLYHRNVEDVTGALREAARVLKRGGRLFITDAAFEALRSRHDLAMHTARRFTRSSLRRCVRDAGLSVKKISYMNFFVFPVVLIVRKLFKAGPETGSSDVCKPSPFINAALKRIMLLEAAMLRMGSLPFGVSLLCVARKD